KGLSTSPGVRGARGDRCGAGKALPDHVIPRGSSWGGDVALPDDPRPVVLGGDVGLGLVLVLVIHVLHDLPVTVAGEPVQLSGVVPADRESEDKAVIAVGTGQLAERFLPGPRPPQHAGAVQRRGRHAHECFLTERPSSPAGLPGEAVYHISKRRNTGPVRCGVEFGPDLATQTSQQETLAAHAANA